MNNIVCKIFGHKWKYYKRSGDDTLYRTCKNCERMGYHNDSTPGWVGMFLQYVIDAVREETAE